MKVSLISTVFNESEVLKLFLHSISIQTRLPDEVVLVDGGSTDDTWKILSTFKFPIKRVKLLRKKGNRSVGRNEAVKNSSSEIIACSDSGCILDKNWLKEIILPFESLDVDVVAGYYKGIAKNVFQECLVPYVLVTPEKLNADTFLPASRSMAFKKRVFEKIGGFQEKLSHNEDYAFSRKLKKNDVKIVFQQKAIVKWIPRSNLREAFVMFFRFAYGDIEARIVRPKVILIFLRYAAVLALLTLFLISENILVIELLGVLAVLYFVWIIVKNVQYIKKPSAVLVFPVIQILSDVAVLSGSILAFIKSF